MINGTVKEFLESGYYSEATLFYHGHTYWFEGDTDFKTGITHEFVAKYPATVVNGVYTVRGSETTELVFEMNDKDREAIKAKLLRAPIFEGKSFWEVESELAWYDEIYPAEPGSAGYLKSR